MVVEAPDNAALAVFISEALPYKVDTETKAVTDRAAMRALAEAMAAPS